MKTGFASFSGCEVMAFAPDACAIPLGCCWRKASCLSREAVLPASPVGNGSLKRFDVCFPSFNVYFPSSNASCPTWIVSCEAWNASFPGWNGAFPDGLF